MYTTFFVINFYDMPNSLMDWFVSTYNPSNDSFIRYYMDDCEGDDGIVEGKEYEMYNYIINQGAKDGDKILISVIW